MFYLLTGSTFSCHATPTAGNLSVRRILRASRSAPKHPQLSRKGGRRLHRFPRRNPLASGADMLQHRTAPTALHLPGIGLLPSLARCAKESGCVIPTGPAKGIPQGIGATGTVLARESIRPGPEDKISTRRCQGVSAARRLRRKAECDEEGAQKHWRHCSSIDTSRYVHSHCQNLLRYSHLEPLAERRWIKADSHLLPRG